MSTKIGKSIKNFRIERGWTQDELAASVGTSRATVSNWERGSQSPSSRMLKRISDAFGMDESLLISNKSVYKEYSKTVPPRSGSYLCYTISGQYVVIPYDKDNDEWFIVAPENKVLKWMEIPKA